MQTQWQPGAMRPQLAADLVDVWRADLAAGGDDLRALLSDAERERAVRFVRAEDGARWAHARGILRALLARYTGVDPRALRIAAGPYGKPQLAGEAGADAAGEVAKLRFNLSHSGNTALIAVASGTEVGVDVELPRRSVDHVAIARRILGDEAAARLARLAASERQREFLRAWVRWEAVLKCRGTGIGGADDAPTGPEPWVAQLDVGPPAAAALAVEHGPCTVRCFQWATAGS
jgi:phosphopantetheinyl transferase